MTISYKKELDELLSLVSLELGNKKQYKTISNHGPFEINAFSITFWVNFLGESAVSKVYIKIPRYIIYDKNINSLASVSEADRRLAEDEYKSLKFLSKNWDTSYGVSFVKPLAYIERYRAVVTEGIKGNFLFKSFRRFDFYQKFGGKQLTHINEGMNNFGKSLYAFHSQNAIETTFKAKEIFPKFNQYSDFLENCGVSNKFLTRTLTVFSKYQDFECPSLEVNSLKGIDIRQIFINQEERLEVIDPGKIFRSYREVDLARFIVTCRILYWGTWLIFFKFIPNRNYEEIFLKGYFDSKKPEKILNFLIIKEFFKQWKMGHKGILNKEWPKFFKYIVKKLYLDPFYKHVIYQELSRLEK